MNSPKINVRYTRHLSLTYTDAKILSQMISRINKEAIKPILAKHNLEYKSFNPEPLTLSKDGLEELREKICDLYHSNRISLAPGEVFVLVCHSKDFLAFKQELKDFLASIRTEMRLDDEGIEFPVRSPILKKWLPSLSGYGFD